MAKLKASDVEDLAKSLIDAAKDRDALYDEMDVLYDQERLQGAGDDSVVLVNMPYATNTIDLITDLAAQMELSINVPAAKESMTAKEEADDAERWLAAWLRRNEHAQQRNFTADAAWFGAQRSAVVMRQLYIEQLVKESDDGYVILTVPVLHHVIDPRYVY